MPTSCCFRCNASSLWNCRILESASHLVSPPLKLTPFEEYMLCDDRPDYPMTGFFRLQFSGKLNSRAMDSAIQTATARHPLLRSRVCRDAVHGYIWATDESIPIPIEKWSADTQSEFPAAAHIDLSRTVGTRIWLVDHESGSDLVVQVHHACSDAIVKCLGEWQNSMRRTICRARAGLNAFIERTFAVCSSCRRPVPFCLIFCSDHRPIVPFQVPSQFLF